MKYLYNRIRWRRVLSGLIVITMLLSGFNCSIIAAYATESDSSEIETLESAVIEADTAPCPHHTEHSYDACGYREAAEATPCQHICDWDCYQKELTCIHAEGGTHDDTCGYSEGTQDIPEVVCDHVCYAAVCGYVAAVEAKEAVACDHQHSKTCGYDGETDNGCTHRCGDGSCSYAEAVAAVEGSLCTHNCNDGTCNYQAAIPGTPRSECTHIHTAACYTVIMKCGHVHDESCGVDGATCTHICDGTCQVPVINCVHTSHDDSCGYHEAVEASPCTYECSECAKEDLPKACTCGAEADESGNIIHAESCDLYTVSAYAGEDGESAEVGFFATLYAGQNATNTGVELTEANNASATLSLSRNLLQISWTYDVSRNQSLSITLPAGLYFEDYTGKGDQSLGLTVQFAKNANQETGTYSNDNTGTLTYSYAPTDGNTSTGTNTIKLNVYVSIDQTVWDKTGQTTVSISGSSPAVSITNGTTTKTVQSVYVSATEARPMTSYIDNESPVASGEDEQKTFQLRFLTGGGRYEETVAWKHITVQLSAKVTKSSTVTVGTTVPLKFSTYGLNFTYADNGYSFTYNEQTGVAEVVYTDIQQIASTVNTLQMGYPMLNLTEEALADLGSDDEITVTYTTSFTSYYGYTYTVANSLTNAVTVKGITAEINLSAGQYAPSASWEYNSNGTYLSCLGRVSFANAAFGDAYDATINVTFGEDLRVQYYRVPMSETATVTVTLGQMNTTAGGATDSADITITKELTSTSASTGAPLSVLMLEGCDSSYYIKEINYSQKTIPANTTYGSGYANNAAGGIWGNLYGGDGSRDIAMEVTYYTTPADTESTEDTRTPQMKTVTKTLQQVTSDTAVGHHAYIEKGLGSTKMNIGDSATLDYTITIHAYPYGGSNYVKNPVIFAVLPKGISVEAVKYSLDNKTWTTMDRGTLRYGEVSGSDDNIWTIDIDLVEQGGLGGYALDSDGNLVQTNRFLYISMDIAADNVTPQTYTLHERLLISSKVDEDAYTKCLAGGTEASSTYTSTLPTGTSLLYGAPPSGDLVVVNPNNNLTVVTEIKKDGANYIYGNGEDHAVYVKNGDNVLYRMTVKNNTTAPVDSSETAIYIPVLHAGMKLDGAMNGAAPNFDASLVGPVNITAATDVEWDIRYCTDENIYSSFLNENSATFADNDLWKEANAITDWSQVTMIKAVVKDGTTYPKNAESELLMTFEIGNCKPSSKAIWNSIIWTTKGNDGQEQTGGVDHHTVFTRLQADISNFKYELTVELGADDVNNQATTVPGLDLSELLELGVNKLKVTGVTPYNMSLKTPDELSIVTGMREQDETFAVELSTDEQRWLDLSVSEFEDMSITVDAQTLTARVTHCTMVDGLTPRYLVVELTGTKTTVEGDEKKEENIALITLTIQLHRTVVVSTVNSIMAGKHYNGIGGGENYSASVQQGGAFTVQINLDSNFAIPDENNNPKISMSGLGGASILLIDKTESESPQYYQPGVHGDEIELTSFVGCGGTSGNFAMTSGAKSLLFIIDLPDSAVGYDCTVTIPSKATTGAITASFTVTVTGSGNAELTGTGNSFTVNNSTGRPAAIKFTLENGGLFPKGAVLKAGDQSYAHSADGSYILVPMGFSGGKLDNVWLDMPYEKLDPGTYTLVATGYVSATANGNAPLGGSIFGTAIMTFTVDAESASAIRLEMDDRLLTKTELASANIRVRSDNVPSWTCALTGSDNSTYAAYANGDTISIPSNLDAGEYILTVTGGGAQSSINFIVVD